MSEEKKNELGLDSDDLENMDTILDELIDGIAKFKGFDEATEADYSELLRSLDFAKFVVSGIIYSNGFDLCAGHDHDLDDDDDDE